MAAKRFHSEYVSKTGDTYTVEIWDTDFSGSSTFFELSGNGFELKYNGGSERHSPIMATECTLEMYAQNATHDALITDVVSSGEGRFLVWIKRGGVNFWRGEILPDIGSYEEMSYPYIIKLRATDGIAALKDIDYNNAGTAYNGKASLLEHLLNCLKKTKWHTDLLTSGTFLSSVIDWWESTHTHTSSSSCALAQTYVDHSAYYKFDKGVQEFLSCYEVLTDILTLMSARITMREGAFWVEQISYRNTTTVIRRNYTKAGTLSSTANYSVVNQIDQTQSGALQAVGSYSFMPGLKKHRHTFKSRLRRNLLDGISSFNQDNTAVIKVYKPIENNGGSAKLRITGDIHLTIISNSPPLADLSPFAIAFEIDIKLNTVYLKRGYVVDSNYQINYSPLTWNTDPNHAYIIVPVTDATWLENSAAFEFSIIQSVDITTPTLPESCDNFDFGFEAGVFQIFGLPTYDPSDFTIKYNFSNMFLEAYSYGTPVVIEDERQYVCENTLYPSNSVITETEAIIGTSIDPNSLGCLWVKPSTAYEQALHWGTGSDTPSKEIEKILCELIASGQARPLERLAGILMGNIEATGRVEWRSKFWLFAGGTWNAHDDEMNGEWFKQDYATGFSTSDPNIIKIKTIDPTVPSAPPSSNSQGSTYETVEKPPGTLFYPVSLTTTDAYIPAGSVTSIDISEILTDGDVYDGDTVVILNPITGVWDELEVTATSTNGQTAISVTGTLSGSYPANSPIIKKPKIGTFSLPEGVAGDLLYHNGTKWAAFNKGTSLQVLRVNSGGTGLEYATLSAGTVTSVGLSLPSIFTVSASPVTTSGTLTGTLASQTANLFFASPNGSSGLPTFRAIALADIANDLITFAKLQNISTARILGRTTAGSGDAEELTAAQVQALIGAINGTLTATRIPFASDPDTVTDDSELTWDNTNKRLVVGVGTSAASLNLFKGAVASWEVIRASGNVSGNMIANFLNSSNASANANSFIVIGVGGTSAGDPFVQYAITGGGSWSHGPDNSDNDIFKLGPVSTPSGGSSWVQVHSDGRTSFGGGAFETGLDSKVSGVGGFGVPSGTNANRPAASAGTATIRYNSTAQGLEVRNTSGTYTSITKQSAPTTAWGTGAGTSPSLTGITHDSRGNLQITTGTSPATNGTVITVTYGHSYNTTPIPVICASNNNASDQNFYVSFYSNSSFSIAVKGTLSASTAYHINYIVKD